MSRFRSQFVFPDLSSVTWYPGHMAKGMRKAMRKLDSCDCVIEVHDARIPFSGRNHKFNSIGRPRLLVLNKIDLVGTAQSENILKRLHDKGEKNVLFTNSRQQQHTSIMKVMESVKELSKYDTSWEEDKFIKLLVIGMPNVGKSSLINALRRTFLKKGKAASVGALPATTTAVQNEIKVSDDPRVYLVDTPGVMIPNLTSNEETLKLAACGILKRQLVDIYSIADYVLFALNQRQLFNYTVKYNLPEPCDDIDAVLTGAAKRLHALEKGGALDYFKTAHHFVQTFQKGELGKISLDIN